MSIHLKYLSFYFSLLVGISACTPTAGRFQSLLDGGKFADAASLVKDEPEEAVALAAAILEKAAATDQYRFFSLERLSAAGKAGRRVLDRLSLRSDDTGRGARIAIERYDRPDTENVVRCFSETAPDVRRLCVFVWHRSFEAEILEKFLLDTDPTVRLYALRGLASLPPDKTRQSIFADVLLRDPSLNVRMEAARRGDLLGADGLLLLKDRLSDENAGMRIAAVSGLAAMDTKAALDLLRASAQGPLDPITLNACAELSRLGDADAKKRLLAAASDHRPVIRSASLYLFSRAKIDQVSKVLPRHLEDKSPEVVLAAANLLRNDETMRRKVVDALQKIAALKTTAAQVRALLAILGHAASEQQLAALLKDASKMSEVELTMLLQSITGAAGLFDDVVQLLGDTREAVRIQSAVFVLFSMSKI